MMSEEENYYYLKGQFTPKQKFCHVIPNMFMTPPVEQKK